MPDFAEQLGGRIKEICKKLGCSLSELERRCGFKRGRLDVLKRGSVPGIEALAEMAKASGTSLEWLLTGIEREGKGLAIPVLRTGGGGHWLVSEQVEAYDLTIPENLVAFQVDGDSMEPVARHGQVVLALPNVRPQSGDLAVVEFQDDTGTFKRVYFEDGQNRIVLVSVNPAYDPMVRKASDIRRAFRVWGVRF